MKIAIAGYGVEGRANYEYWNTPENQVVIVDERDIPTNELPSIDTSVITGTDAFARLEGYDMVVRTAGLAPSKIRTDGKIWSSTNEFFEKCPAPIVGVTGSKGKGTTSSLIAGILRAAGKKVHLLGNIGVPALSALSEIEPDDIVVYELSSFQLWDIKRSPNVAVVLHIEQDHLDVHADFEDYVNAKANIAIYQSTTDRIVYNASNEWSYAIARKSVGQRIVYPSDRTVYVRDNHFYYQDMELCSIENLQLPGWHNVENACAAILAAWSWVQEGAIIAEGLRSFSGLPHRLKLVNEIGGVRYYDDSIATTPGSAVAAVKAFPEPKILILGGSSKGADFKPLAQQIASSNVRRVILIGAEAERINAYLNEEGYKNIDLLGDTVTMQEIVACASRNAEVGDVVILSPSCASFGMFTNYADRGDQFIEAVESMAASSLLQ